MCAMMGSLAFIIYCKPHSRSYIYIQLYMESAQFLFFKSIIYCSACKRAPDIYDEKAIILQAIKVIFHINILGILHHDKWSESASCLV